MKYLNIILGFLFVFSCNTSKENEKRIRPENDNFKQLTATIDEYVADMLSKGNANTFALAIYKDGNLYQNYYGEVDKGANNKPDDNSLFEIASITKTFTGNLIAKEVIKGTISLEDDIRMYLKGDYSNLEYQGEPITIRDLLTHCIGLKHKHPEGLESALEKVRKNVYDTSVIDYDMSDLLEELKTVELDKKPGTDYDYSYIGPELLAYVLEQLNNKSFEAQIEAFFTEMGMDNSYLQNYDKHKAHMANGYKADTLVKADYNPLLGGAGGAIATLPDMASYMKYLVNHKDEDWIKEASKVLFVDEDDDESIGYLWQNIGFAEEEGYYYSKTGTSNGIQSGVLICPDSDYGIVLMVNNTSDEAINDWGNLFFRDIEPDLIKYPKLNLFSRYKDAIAKGSREAIANYNKLKTDTTKYYTVSAEYLNNIGYEYLGESKHNQAIAIFTFAIEQFPNNFNLYDSLGEAYYINENYAKALENYKKALQLNPESENAKNYIQKIEKLIS